MEAADALYPLGQSRGGQALASFVHQVDIVMGFRSVVAHEDPHLVVLLLKSWSSFSDPYRHEAENRPAAIYWISAQLASNRQSSPTDRGTI